MYVLAQRNASLTEIGRVDGLGKGERIHSVRFIGAGAYVVTFRQTDPLYTLDLKDPRRPRLTGELKITGYSAYLHPTADGRLLGVGQDADTSGRTSGLQISLFDVSGEPRRVGARKLPGTSSRAEFDPHAFLYWPETGLTVVPVLRPGRGAAGPSSSRSPEPASPRPARSAIPGGPLATASTAPCSWAEPSGRSPTAERTPPTRPPSRAATGCRTADVQPELQPDLQRSPVDRRSAVWISRSTSAG